MKKFLHFILCPLFPHLPASGLSIRNAAFWPGAPLRLLLPGSGPSSRVGLLEDELGVTEPQEMPANNHVHPCVSERQYQTRQGQEARGGCSPHPPAHQACPCVQDLPAALWETQVGKLRLREGTWLTQGHTAPGGWGWECKQVCRLQTQCSSSLLHFIHSFTHPSTVCPAVCVYFFSNIYSFIWLLWAFAVALELLIVACKI